ncbi:hypothetical protein GJAV_G00120260 [Gymnothorax javanicus]|nr:hypothetical protein GJAV_G00120260 [Gymnothorax javanicus]
MEEEKQTIERRETFLRVRANRQTRLNVDVLCWCRRYAKESLKSAPLPSLNEAPLAPCCIRHARIGKMKRRKPEDGQVCPLCYCPLLGSEEEMSRHVELCLLKREGACGADDDSADVDGENGTPFEEYEWCGQKRVRATSLLEGGFRGSGFATCSTKENHDSDADLDVDGDDTLEYGKAQYTEADIIPCSGDDQGEAREREALRGAVLNGGTPSHRIATEFSKWASDEMPSTSNGESSQQDPGASSSGSAQRTCKNSDIEKITEDSTATTLEALKARIRELEKQILRGDRYKCLICMESYTMPLASIQCWHVHCEECWLRTLGNKKLCPQCNTITSPGDLRRVYFFPSLSRCRLPSTDWPQLGGGVSEPTLSSGSPSPQDRRDLPTFGLPFLCPRPAPDKETNGERPKPMTSRMTLGSPAPHLPPQRVLRFLVCSLLVVF